MLLRIIIIVALFFPVHLFAQKRFVVQVVDATTGEKLPFAQVYKGNIHLTMTNLDGMFTMEASPSDSLLITCFGYKPIGLVAKELGDIVKMEMMTTLMREVTIHPIEYWLKKASKKLSGEYRRFRNRKARYFYRERIKRDTLKSLVEAFVDANSAVNLRHIIMRTGRQMGAHWGTSELWLNAQVGVMTKGVKYWKEKELISPLSPGAGEAFYKKYYDITYELLNDGNGGKIYQLYFQKKKENTRQPIITGFLYLDAKTLSPLVLHGRIENVLVWIGELRFRNCKVSLHLEYTTVNGFLEVSNITTFCAIEKGLTNRITLFRLDEEISPDEINYRASELGEKKSIVKHVSDVGYDSAFWARHQVIMQTEEERLIATGFLK